MTPLATKWHHLGCHIASIGDILGSYMATLATYWAATWPTVAAQASHIANRGDIGDKAS